MAKWFNNFLVTVVPLLPRIFVGFVARKYVSGDTIEEALVSLRTLQAEGYRTTTDILGEHIHYLEETEPVTNMYIELTDQIAREQLPSGISLKLSQLGIELDRDVAWYNFHRILEAAMQKRLFVRIDMEDSSLTDITLDFYERARQIYNRVGFVLQAYMHRSASDLERLLAPGVNVRICKGIYKESPQIALQNPDDIRTNFVKLVRMLLENGRYAAIATHDLKLIETCKQYIIQNDISPDRYEFQALYGVPIDGTLRQLQAEGHRVRIYLPFGKEWYPYCMRRLKENPDIAGYIFKDFFKSRSPGKLITQL